MVTNLFSLAYPLAAYFHKFQFCRCPTLPNFHWRNWTSAVVTFGLEVQLELQNVSTKLVNRSAQKMKEIYSGSSLWNFPLKLELCTRVGTLIVATIYLQLIQN